MLVSHQSRFIYLKTLKTGGTSVEMFFEPFCVDPKRFTPAENKPQQVSSWGIVGSRGSADDTWYNHMPAAQVRDLLGDRLWNQYLKFCVVRNPYDKVVSSFWYDLNPVQAHILRDADFAVVRREFRTWLEQARFPVDRHIYTIAGELAVDHVIRHERLAEGMHAVCSRLGLPWQPNRMPRLKAGFRLRPEPFPAYYDHAAVTALIQQHYAWEIERFCYRTEL